VRIALVAVLVLAPPAAVVAAAQAATAVAGVVSDVTGAGLPGVVVRLESSGARPDVETITDGSGRYRIEVPPGRYTAVFAAPDFATVRRDGLEVEAGRTATLSTVLQLSLSAHVTVTGKRTFSAAEATEGSLTGIADTASQGIVTAKRIDARPIMRAGELVETVPGLVVSQHSGEGKANQFYLRGFNLDHGTDFAATVAGVPVNMPSHGHGQGYLDLNFLIPELVSRVQFRKGPYFADQGDFSVAGATHIDYVSHLDAPLLEVAAGGQGWARALAAASPRLAGGHLLAAVELNRHAGPWEQGEGARKRNAVLRYTRGDVRNGWSITGMTYAAEWSAADQVPQRAVSDGRIGRFGAVDWTNGGDTYRHSVAFDLQRAGPGSLTRASAYLVGYGLDLFSNFTYFLDDPVNGDQFEQVDRRVAAGFSASRATLGRWRGRSVEHRAGVQMRHDAIGAVELHATRSRARLATVRSDRIDQTSVAGWADSKVQWTNWLRTTAGLRADVYRFGVDASLRENGGSRGAALVSPKLGVVFGPWRATDVYANAGFGFHSNDARGTTIAADPRSGEPVDRVAPLVRARGAEAGIRTGLLPRVQATVTAWMLRLDSELLFVGDAGTTTAGRASRRHGVEISAEAALAPWLTFDADLAFSMARFGDADPGAREVPGSVPRVASLGLATDRDRLLFGSLRMRHLGGRPLTEDGTVRSRPTTLLNAGGGVRLSRRASLVIDAFNLLGARASDIDYFYASRLPGEPAAGIEDVHTHPALPRTLRVALTLSY
jgi:hypothetical protein